jgi:3-hydroxyisobutyrate dehydrogenase-like beta-hydroxyacid dehydrogenase
MRFDRIGIMTPGDMGQAIGAQLRKAGYDVVTALDARSDRSRALAREAGIEDVGSIARLVAECELILSIMNPAAATGFADEAARELRAAGRDTLLVDCNAVSPDTVQAIAHNVTTAGGRFVDAGIIGAPPRPGTGTTTLYVSGPQAAELEQLAGPQLAIVQVSQRIGDASALKMCSAALTKGTQALWLEVLIAARRLGIAELLEQEVRGGARAPILDWSLKQFAILPPKAYRWVPEMREIGATLGAAGITPKTFDGVGEIYDFVARTPLGQASVEANRERGLSGSEVVRALAGQADGSAP